MRKLAVVGVAFLGLLFLGVWMTVEAPLALLFGWVLFLVRTLPRVSIDWPSVAVGCLACVLLAGGIHRLGGTWRRQGTGPGPAKPWRVRWSVAGVIVVGLLFAAGIFFVGLVHQTVWLLTSDRPLGGPALASSGWGRSENNLRQIGMAAHTYAGSNRDLLMPGGTFTSDGGMLHSWETHLLIYVGYSPMGIDYTRAWNDPVNETYFKSVLPVFINPSFRTPELEDAEGYGLSHYAANIRILSGNQSMRLTDLKSGTSTTLLIGEVNGDFKPWGHPANWRDPLKGINRSSSGFGGPKGAGGATFVMADGSVRFVSDQVSPDVLRALSIPDAKKVETRPPDSTR